MVDRSDTRTTRTSGLTTWRAGCSGSCTSGSEGGPEKPTSRKAGRALRSDPYTEIRNRGVEDVLFVCCDGLKGLADAIEATWPQASVQTCVVHLIRASLRYCSYKDRKKVAAALRPIYTAATVEAALDAMDTFELEHGDRYPGIVALWRNSWERFIPFLAYPPQIRKIVYTTNMIESVNYQLRKVSKTRGHFPTDEAALKLLRLAARDINTTRAGAAGTGTHGWKEALNLFEIHFPGRLDPATM